MTIVGVNNENFGNLDMPVCVFTTRQAAQEYCDTGNALAGFTDTNYHRTGYLFIMENDLPVHTVPPDQRALHIAEFDHQFTKNCIQKGLPQANRIIIETAVVNNVDNPLEYKKAAFAATTTYDPKTYTTIIEGHDQNAVEAKYNELYQTVAATEK